MAAAGVSHRVIVVGCCCHDLSSFILFSSYLYYRKGIAIESFV
ncbi:hypothetical protein [Bacillus sp. FSL L8-0152]